MNGGKPAERPGAVGRLKMIAGDLKIIFSIYVVVAAAAGLHKYLIHKANNFLIFRTSFYNLIARIDLYALHTHFHYDYYKYSPTFAMLMAPIAILPPYLGVITWSLVNALPLYYAIKTLDISNAKKALVLWIILIELLTSIQNTQSNGLYAALIVLAFVMFEKKRLFWAASMVMMAGYIKIFGLAAIVLFLLYPGRLKFLLYCAFWFAVMALLPLLVVPPEHLLFLYKSWYGLLTRDVAHLQGLSVMGILRVWFGLAIPNAWIMIPGALLLFLPLLRRVQFEIRHFRFMFLSSLLIWLIIFNHKAESPMFVIAVTGVAIWYVMQKPGLADKILLWLTLILTSFSVTDITPLYVRQNLVQPYLLKVVPCILIWFRLQWQLLTSRTFLPDNSGPVQDFSA